MRRRLVFAFVALTVLVVALYGVPRAFIRIDQVQYREQEQVDQSALLLAALVGAEQRAGEIVTEEMLLAGLRPGERVEYVDSDGSVVAAGDPAAREVGVEATAPVAGGGSLTLDYSQDALDERIQDALLPLLLIGLLLVGFAWLAARVLARRLARPFQDLAEHARALGSGRFDLDVPHYDVPEAEEIGQALRTSAHTLDQLVRRERDFAVRASHELRTPLTAALLRLEDLALWESTSPEVADELAEILHECKRMDLAVAALLERDRGQRTAATPELDLTALVLEAAERWRSRLAAAGRDLTTEAEQRLRARLPAVLLSETLDALLDHKLEYGEGDVSLVAARTADYLEVRVGDESRRTQGTELLHTGPNASSTLPRAAELAASVGGHLTVGTGPSTSFLLRLPLPSSGTAADGPAEPAAG